MNNSYFLKQEKQSFFELLKQLELNPLLETLLVDAYQRGYQDGIQYTKDHSTRQVQHGGVTESQRTVYGGTSDPQSTVPTDSEGAES